MVIAMTTSELIERLANKHARLSARDVDESVNDVLDATHLPHATGRRPGIRGFGSFCLNYRPERVGRNPKSGESVVVPAKYVPHFKAGKEMRLRVDANNTTSNS